MEYTDTRHTFTSWTHTRVFRNIHLLEQFIENSAEEEEEKHQLDTQNTSDQNIESGSNRFLLLEMGDSGTVNSFQLPTFKSLNRSLFILHSELQRIEGKTIEQ